MPICVGKHCVTLYYPCKLYIFIFQVRVHDTGELRSSGRKSGFMPFLVKPLSGVMQFRFLNRFWSKQVSGMQ